MLSSPGGYLIAPHFREGNLWGKLSPVAPPQDAYKDKLRDAMTEAGVSRTQLSKMLGARPGKDVDTEYNTLGKYLSGKRVPDRYPAATLAVLLDAPELLVDGRRSPQAGLLDRLEALASDVTALGETLTAGQEEILGLLRSRPAAGRRPA